MRRVLIVDDELDVLASMADLVGMLPGHQVYMTTSAHEARALLRSAAWDVVIVDELLADGSGLELLDEVASRQHHVVRALMSAHPVFQQLADGLNFGIVDRFFSKPYDPAKVEAWLMELGARAKERPARSGLGRIPPATAHRD